MQIIAAMVLSACRTIVVPPVCESDVLCLELPLPELKRAAPLAVLKIEVALSSSSQSQLWRAKPLDDPHASIHIVVPNQRASNHIIRLKVPSGLGAATRVRLLLRDGDGTTVAGANIVVSEPYSGRRVMVPIAGTNDDECDIDRDWVPNCNKPGCCGSDDTADCDDNEASASPFELEDPCFQCDNGIDEDCDGQDVACVDGDKDGVADCVELTCGPSAAKDPSVYPGAPEICDAKDNDCDVQVDEGISYVGIDGVAGDLKLGDTCGKGVCEGGKVQCSADGKTLACSSADKKAVSETCGNKLDDDCNGKADDGCTPDDIDGDGASNALEDSECKHPYAKFHTEIYPSKDKKEACCVAMTTLILKAKPDWSKGEAIPEAAKVTDAVLIACDSNCDEAVDPCDPNDADGDGVPAPLDCDDADPLTYPGAAEKCGDGKVQGCVGADPACASVTDADGDGWSAPADCDDGDKTTFPGAKEVCNGKDTDCDGYIDGGNPEANDAVCGDPDGECGKKMGISVCKRYPPGTDPGPYECLLKAFDKSVRVCVSCVCTPQ